MKYSIPELKVTYLREPSTEILFNSCETVWEIWESVKLAPWFDYDKECMVLVSLDTQNRIKGFILISLGGFDRNRRASPRYFQSRDCGFIGCFCPYS